MPDNSTTSLFTISNGRLIPVRHEAGELVAYPDQSLPLVSPVAPREVFDLEGGADYLCVCPRTLRRLADEGRISYTHVSAGAQRRGIRFRKQDLDRYLERNAVAPLRVRA